MSTEEQNAAQRDVAEPTATGPAADPISRDDANDTPQGSSLISLYWDNAAHDDERGRSGVPPLWSPPQVNRLLRLLAPNPEASNQ